MPPFSYTAYDANGRRLQGEIAAATRQQALDILHSQGATPVDVHLTSIPHPNKIQKSTWRQPRFLSPDELLLLTRELAILLAAELSLDESLQIAAVQPSFSNRSKQKILGLLERVLAGASLSEAFAAVPGTVPPVYRFMIAAAEKNGNIAVALKVLADDLENEAELRAQLRGALLYPLTLLVASVLTVALVVGILVPAIIPLFADAGANPPQMIAWLEALRMTMLNYWPVLAVSLVLLAVVFATMRRHPIFVQVRDSLQLRLLIVGGLVARRETARFTGTMATLLTGGTPLLEALHVVASVHVNQRYKNAAMVTEAHVANGGTLSEALAQSGLFGALTLRLTAVGERTGQLDTMLARIARMEEAALRRELERLVAVAAPLLTILIGFIVGGIILSVMGAIIGLNDLAFR